MKFLGFNPGPFENKFHYLNEIWPAFLLIEEQIKKEYSFLWASNRALEMFVNITFVILSFNFFILNYGTIPCSALLRP